MLFGLFDDLGSFLLGGRGNGRAIAFLLCHPLLLSGSTGGSGGSSLGKRKSLLCSGSLGSDDALSFFFLGLLSGLCAFELQHCLLLRLLSLLPHGLLLVFLLEGLLSGLLLTLNLSLLLGHLDPLKGLFLQLGDTLSLHLLLG